MEANQNNKYACLQAYKHIVFCFPHANSLGIVRSIAREGLNPIVVSIAPVNEDSGFYHSKYVKELYRFATPEEGVDFVITKYGNDSHKNFLYLIADFGVRICDERYNTLKDRFLFNSGGYLPKPIFGQRRAMQFS